MSPNYKRVESKLCKRCGRPFQNRKKWRLRGIWEQVLYCSDKCRSQGVK
ncbi:DUF2256 domain-containing protein [Verrucomicrobia bacterium]|nr:DUF2256 domain-containing protein [Verrucomicrobiota bacterium]